MKILHGIFDLRKVTLLPQEDFEVNVTDMHTRVNQYFSMNLNDEIIRTNFEFEPKILRYSGIMLQDFLQNGGWDNPISLYIDRTRVIRAHPGTSRLLFTRFLGISRTKCIVVAQENEFQHFPDMIPISKEQFKEEYPNLSIDYIPNTNQDKEDLAFLKRHNMEVYYKYDHFEIRTKEYNEGKAYTSSTQDTQWGNKILLSLSYNLPVYTDMSQEELDNLISWTRHPYMDSYLSSYLNRQDRGKYQRQPMKLIREPLNELSRVRGKYKTGCVLKIGKTIKYNPWELLMFIHGGYSKLCTSDNSVELIHLGAEGLPTGILPDRYSDVNYEGTRSKNDVAF